MVAERVEAGDVAVALGADMDARREVTREALCQTGVAEFLHEAEGPGAGQFVGGELRVAFPIRDGDVRRSAIFDNIAAPVGEPGADPVRDDGAN